LAAISTASLIPDPSPGGRRVKSPSPSGTREHWKRSMGVRKALDSDSDGAYLSTADAYKNGSFPFRGKAGMGVVLP
jgi:hypothetical protein